MPKRKKEKTDDLRDISYSSGENKDLQEQHQPIVSKFAPGENQNLNEHVGKINDPGDEYLFPYWDEYSDES
jgi:hypothetical protein